MKRTKQNYNFLNMDYNIKNMYTMKNFVPYLNLNPIISYHLHQYILIFFLYLYFFLMNF